MKRETLSILVLEPNILQCQLIKLALIRHGMNPIICNQPPLFVSSWSSISRMCFWWILICQVRMDWI
ncbi:hypothetical protein [Candidatus Villigracilis saccharophilus]|uniref:hypothetical protein n=1 Tax=Candidatus Villigracilis saccharophilus TaxID=3140684 RepID=UPI003136E357|nr:hypothetical protein [Anaerolineales bacterium]